MYGMLSTVPRPASIELPCHHWAALGLAGVFSVEPRSCIASYLYSSSICQYTVYLPSILFAVGESFLVFNHSTHFWLLFQMVYSLSISQLFLSIRFISPTVLYRFPLLGASIRFLGCCDTANGLELSGNVRFICPVYSLRLELFPFLDTFWLLLSICVPDGIRFIHLPTVVEYTVYQPPYSIGCQQLPFLGASIRFLGCCDIANSLKLSSLSTQCTLRGWRVFPFL